MELGAIVEDDLRTALASFDGVWEQLVVKEKTRLLQLVVERIDFDGAKGEVQITYRPGGIQVLAEKTP